MEPMKLLHVFPNLGGGGTEQVILNISDYLYRRSEVVIAICASLPAKGSRIQDFKDRGIQIFDVPFFFHKKRSIRNMNDIKKAIRSFRPDIVHSHSLYSLLLVYFIRKCFGLKYKIIHTGHGGPQENYDDLARKYAWMADAYVAIAEPSFDYLSKHARKKNIRLIYNGTGRPGRNEIFTVENGSGGGQENKEPMKMVFIGRIAEQKGLPVLIEAVDRIVKKGIDVRLDIIGEGDALPQLRQMAERKGLSDCIFFRGFIGNPWAAVAQTPLIIMPSLWEPGGLVAIEALIRNHTVVASGVGGLKDIIRDGINGYLFEKGDDAELAEKLIEINERKSYIRLTSAEKEKYYFENGAGPAYSKLYSGLLRGRPGLIQKNKRVTREL